MCATKAKSGLASRVARPLLAGALAAAAAAPLPATAGTDMFLKLEGITGDAQDKVHKGEIDILSYTQSFSNTAKVARGTTSGPGRVTCGAVTVLKQIDSSSPQLIMLVTTGAHVPTGVLTFQQTGGEGLVYQKITMTDVIVTGVEQSDQPDALIMEKVSLLADRFLFEHRGYDPKGGGSTVTKFGFDCATHEKF